MVIQLNAVKAQDGSAVEQSEGSLRLIAFANHMGGKRNQTWDEFEEAGLELGALRKQAELGHMPLLEVSCGRVQFVHLSYQEYLAAEVLSRLLNAGVGNFGAWLRG